MKIPLQYQRSEYDCGPTAFLNAISFLFPRNEVPPDILRYVMMYTLDRYNNKGEACKEGTFQMAMSFLAGWLNQYAKATQFPITCEFLGDEQVSIGVNSRIIEALRQGGAVVLRVRYGCWHYITLTGVSGDTVELFDPYFRIRPFKQKDIKLITDKPGSANRCVPFSCFNDSEKGVYALGSRTRRAAVILHNPGTRSAPEDSIEYFL